MSEQENLPSDSSEQTTPKRGWSRRRKFLTVLLGLVAVGAGYYCYRDKPLKLVQTTEINRKADPKTGEVVDYRYAYNALQEEAIAPVEENGWRAILQTLGPIALGRCDFAETIPWEEFPTNEKSKKWFEEEWTILCEKFKLDPHARPTALGRLSLTAYLAKNGLTGNEPEPTTDSDFSGYWENYERRPARIKVVDAEARLWRPWTAEEYPVAARWFEENADVIDALSQAARMPKLVCWTIVPDVEKGTFVGTPFPTLQWTREFVRILMARANLRVGSGDISGAIDDVETMTRFARPLLESDYSTLIATLVGVASLGMAFSVPMYGNAAVQPTDEERARLVELWESFYRDGQMARYIESAKKGEARCFGFAAYADILTLRRKGNSVGQIIFDPDGLDGDSQPFFVRALEWLLVAAPPMNDAKSLRIFQDLYESMLEQTNEEIDETLNKSMARTLAGFWTAPEKTLATTTAALWGPAMEAGKEALSRMECLAKETTIMFALQAYRAEHGTFPPAYTLDASGKPLHSWRVLILPYLGDDAKALYGQIALDEPWDSEHNAAFHAQIPDVFRCPSATDLKEGETRYSVLLGDDGFFDASGVGKDPTSMATLPGREIARQLLVVERSDPVCWMQPDAELKIADYLVDHTRPVPDPENPPETYIVDANGVPYDVSGVRKFFGKVPHSGGINVVPYNGGSRFISETSSPDELESWLQGTPEPPKRMPAEALLDDETDESETDEVATPDEAAPSEEPAAVEEPAEAPDEAAPSEEPAAVEGSAEAPDETAPNEESAAVEEPAETSSEAAPNEEPAAVEEPAETVEPEGADVAP